MIKVTSYRGHIRNWGNLCRELSIDLGLSREERENEIIKIIIPAELVINKVFPVWKLKILIKKVEITPTAAITAATLFHIIEISLHPDLVSFMLVFPFL